MYVSSFHCFSLCNEHISNFLVCFILFQRFSTISYSFHLLQNRNGFIKKNMYVSSFHSFSPCFVTSFEQVFWSVTSCFRVFLIHLNRLFVTKQKWVYKKKKKMYVSSFHSVSLCFVTSIFQIFWSVSSCFRVFPIYHLLRNRNGFIKKKNMYVSSFHSVSPCFVTSFEQVFWSVTSCFRVFPIYLNRFICNETEMCL